MRFRNTLLLAALTILIASSPAAAADPTIIDVRRIWDAAPHNAFTDLIRHQGRWVCAFREAPAHKGGVRDSRIRVLVSDDATTWTAAGEMSDPRGDIRDAKLAILPDGRLMLLTAIQLFDRTAGQSHQSIAFFSTDARTWEGPIDVGEPNVWLWGIKFHKEIGYSIGYGTGGARFVRLYRTSDGVKFEPVGEKLEFDKRFANESAIHFDDDDTARVLLRFDPDPALIGTARPPYTKWDCKETNERVGGPELTRTPDGRLLGGGRLWTPKPRMSLFWIDPDTGKLTECVTLPSGGDTSYPGFVWHDGVLHLSYYSSHEGGKSCIYLARVRVPGTSR